MRATFYLLAFSLLVHYNLVASECKWDQSVDLNQDLDPVSLEAGALNLGRLTDVGPEKCQEACCSLPDCDLALVGLPADGEPQCQLVKCLSQDRDLCVLRPSTQFKVYRKKATPSRTAEGHKLHVVPLDIGDQKTNETNNFRCRLPMKVGSCRAAFTRFFYNVTSGNCSRFTFGGCEANGNNFYSQDECEAACSGVTGSVLPIDSTPAPPVKAPRMAPSFNAEPSEDEVRPADSESVASEAVPTEHCGEEPQPGPCRAAFKRWFFNKKTGNCETFIYGGCKGNNNNHLSEKSCRETCLGTVLPSSKKSPADEYTPEYRDQCVVTPDPGRCRAAFPKFYFDYSSGTCRSFVYGGCGGNGNRYDTENECTSRCSGGGVFNSRGKTRDRKTAAIFLFITLAAISALVLVTLVIVSLRRHRLTRRPSSISDKEELLPDEQSSVDSLTIPDSPKPDKP